MDSAHAEEKSHLEHFAQGALLGLVLAIAAMVGFDVHDQLALAALFAGLIFG